AEVKLSPEVSGEIIELPIKEGEQVTKGQLLVRINPDIYQAAVSRGAAAVSSSQANLAQAQAQFVEAERNFNRNKTLFEKGVISAADFDGIQRAYDVARLGVESARFNLRSAEATAKEARDNLFRTTLYAPADGTVSRLNVEVGERVVGTAQMAGTELLRIANLDQMEVVVDVNENDIVRVGLGDTAVIEVDAYLGEKFKGTVTEIANSAKSEGTTADQITNFQVRIRILKTSYEHLIDLRKGPSPFRPGMTASVDIQTAYRENVLAVPIQAVTLRSVADSALSSATDKKKEVVFVLDAATATQKVVKTGVQDMDFIEVLEGLKKDEEVVSGPYILISRTLKDGSEVIVNNKKP
ncbi:MAG: efflux RND transporter periplasmic adaptor subunit, partial [Schleiferiaceae bacterium]|nr:efflux RND transporter periplasmic adaptor subunit [Schleiferiaceae bacterium]